MLSWRRLGNPTRGLCPETLGNSRDGDREMLGLGDRGRGIKFTNVKELG